MDEDYQQASVFTHRGLADELEDNPLLSHEMDEEALAKMEKWYQNIVRCRADLAPGAIPDKISCRNPEKETIQLFVKSGLRPESTQSKVMFIAGLPGTGKTVLVTEVGVGNEGVCGA